MLEFIKLTRKQAVKLSRKHSTKVLEAAFSIPSHEAQKWREGVVGELRLSPYYDCDRAASVRASKLLDMEYTFFFMYCNWREYVTPKSLYLLTKLRVTASVV